METGRQAAQTNLKIGGINHFAIQVEDLDEAVSTLKAKGTEVVSPPKMFPTEAVIVFHLFTTTSEC